MFGLQEIRKPLCILTIILPFVTFLEGTILTVYSKSFLIALPFFSLYLLFCVWSLLCFTCFLYRRWYFGIFSLAILFLLCSAVNIVTGKFACLVVNWIGREWTGSLHRFFWWKQKFFCMLYFPFKLLLSIIGLVCFVMILTLCFRVWKFRRYVSDDNNETELDSVTTLNSQSLMDERASNYSDLWFVEMSRYLQLFRLFVTVFLLLSLMCIVWTVYVPLKNILLPSSQVISEDCHFILTPGNCMLPFPSDYFLSLDKSPFSGPYANRRLPRFRFRNGWDLEWLSQDDMDGFSRLSPIVFSLENLNPADLIGYDQVHLSLENNATSILVDAITGERTAHFYSSSHFFDDSDPYAAVAMHPAEPLIEGHRYIFAIRNIRNRKNTSSLAKSPKGFQIIRDNLTAMDASLDETLFHHFGYVQLQQMYHRDIFSVLDRHGFVHSQLQLAWQFTVKSKNTTLRPAKIIQSTLLSLFSSIDNEADKPKLEINEIKEHSCELLPKGRGWFRKIHGQVTKVPLFLEEDRPGTKLSHPLRQTGTTIVPFTVLLPCSLFQAGSQESNMLLQYGHGLMGSQGEAQNDYLERIANDYNIVVWAVDWRGMSQYDILSVFKMLLIEPDHFALLPHNVLQGLSDATVVLWTMLSRSFRELDAMQINGTPVLPPFPTMNKIDFHLSSIPIGYYGNSQGGILGAALVGFSPFYSSGVLGVAGAPYSLLISESIDAIPYIRALQLELSLRDIPLYASLIQQLWDIGEPTGWLSTLIDDGKFILLHAAIQDRQVPIAGAEVLGRGLNASLTGPQERTVFGWSNDNNSATWLYPHSQLVEWSVAQGANFPPHECVRRTEKQVAQSMEFLFSHGYVFQVCQNDCTLSNCTFY